MEINIKKTRTDIRIEEDNKNFVGKVFYAYSDFCKDKRYYLVLKNGIVDLEKLISYVTDDLGSADYIMLRDVEEVNAKLTISHMGE